MLGLGRASQYAGWWNQGQAPGIVNFTASGALSYTNRQTPSYSLLVNNFGLSYGTLSSGNVDLTGYSSLTGFNNGKLTTVNTFRPEWPDPIGSTTDFVSVNIFNEVAQGGTSYFLNPSVSLYNNNTQIQLQVPGIFQETGLSYSVINNRWVTLVSSISNSQSDYVDWTDTGTSGTSYCRACLFDTVTGELLYRRDIRNTVDLPSVSSMPTSIPTNQSGNNYIFSGGNGSGSSETTLYEFRLSNHWISVGTMFDPLGSTDTSWRTTRPSATIGTAVAWLNMQTAEFESVGSPAVYYVPQTDMDLYTETNNRIMRNSGWTEGEWTEAYSDTIITTDQG